MIRDVNYVSDQIKLIQIYDFISFEVYYRESVLLNKAKTLELLTELVGCKEHSFSFEIY